MNRCLVLCVVDDFTVEELVAPLRQAHLHGQRQQLLNHRGFPQIFAEVDQHVGGTHAVLLKALGFSGKGLAQIEVTHIVAS